MICGVFLLSLISIGMEALDFFNDIVCINLRSRPDRRQYMTSLLNKLEIPCRFHTVTKHPKGGRYGCFESHIQVIQECYNKGDKYIIVLEDDIVPSQSYSKTLFKHAIQFMKSHNCLLYTSPSPRDH
jgi:glycosyl transferase family 25